PYAIFAALSLRALRGKRLNRLFGATVPLVDVLLIYMMQRNSLPISPHPAGVAGFSLGLFVFTELLASLTLTPALILVTAGVCWICEGALQVQAGVGFGAIVASGVVLMLAAGVTIWAARRVEELVERTVSEEVARRMATERSEKLEQSNHALAAAQADLEAKHAQLLQAQREAESLSRLLIHDLKGPLTTILSYTDLVTDELRRRPELSQLADDLRTADAAGRRMLEMIGDLLSISRLERR